MIRVRVLLVLLAAGALMAGIGCAATSVDPQARQVLKRMSVMLGSVDAFSFRAVGTMDEAVRTGQLAQFSRTSKGLVVRPGKLHVQTEGDDARREVWFDQGTLTVLDKLTNEYATDKVPATIEKMVDWVVEEYGLTLPISDLLFRKPYDVLMEEVQGGFYAGLQVISGVECHHLAFRHPNVDWQIWIETGEKALPRKLVLVYKNEEGDPQFSATMDDWNLSPQTPDDAFKPVLPAGAKKIEMDDLFGLDEGE